MVKRKGTKKKTQPRKGILQKGNSTYPELPPPKKQHYSLREEALQTGRNHLPWNESVKLRYKTIQFVSGGFLAGNLSEDSDASETFTADNGQADGVEDEEDFDVAASSQPDDFDRPVAMTTVEGLLEEVEVEVDSSLIKKGEPDRSANEEGATIDKEDALPLNSTSQLENLAMATTSARDVLNPSPVYSSHPDLEKLAVRSASSSMHLVESDHNMTSVERELHASGESESEEEVLFHGRDAPNTRPTQAVQTKLELRQKPKSGSSMHYCVNTSSAPSDINNLVAPAELDVAVAVTSSHVSQAPHSRRKARRRPGKSSETDEDERLALEDYKANLEAQLDEESADGTAAVQSIALRNLALEDGLDDDAVMSQCETVEDLEVNLHLFMDSFDSDTSNPTKYATKHRKRSQSGHADRSKRRRLGRQERLLLDTMGAGDETLSAEQAHLSSLSDSDTDTDLVGTTRQNHISARHKNTRTQRRKDRNHETSSDDSLIADILQQDPDNFFNLVDSIGVRSKSYTQQYIGHDLGRDSDAMMGDSDWQDAQGTRRITKAERRLLRKQGLMGRKSKRQQPAEIGFTDVDAFMSQFSQFLASDKEILQLPPMQIKDRKLMHELGMRFGLKTKSVGKKNNRATTLIRTKRTSRFDKATYQLVARNFRSDKFTSLDRTHRRQGGGRSTGGAVSGVTYRNGEVVGAGADEIGSDNKGRAMLEKLGWKHGMALGAEGSNGILQPITHTVKIGKGGLT